MTTESMVHPKVPTMLIPSQYRLDKQTKWRKYLGDGGKYEIKVPRYALVTERLIELGLDNTHQIMDFGAGRTWFDYYLRKNLDWMGMMLNLDGALDGEELDTFYPHGYTDFMVSIETIEHFNKPGELIAKLEGATELGIVFTTPNPDTVDVKALDETHVSPISVQDWNEMYYTTEVHTIHVENDTILAYKDMTK